jgi:hypothetical protein
VTAWQKTFIAALARCPNVSAAARKARKTRSAAYKARAKEPAFAEAWDDAIEQSTDDLVGVCYKRAITGWLEPVYYKGKKCGTVRRFSNSLAMALLKAHRPDTYGERPEKPEAGTLIDLTGEAEERARAIEDKRRKRSSD